MKCKGVRKKYKFYTWKSSQAQKSLFSSKFLTVKKLLHWEIEFKKQGEMLASWYFWIIEKKRNWALALSPNVKPILSYKQRPTANSQKQELFSINIETMDFLMCFLDFMQS